MSENLPEITPEAARDFARALMPELAGRLQLIEFLTARYDEEEAVARLDRFAIAFVPDGETYRWDDESCVVYVSAVHLLADIAAKRSILSNARYALEIAQDEAPRHPTLSDAHSHGYRLGQWHGYHTALRLLAQVFAEHPDFDPEWTT